MRRSCLIKTNRANDWKNLIFLIARWLHLVFYDCVCHLVKCYNKSLYLVVIYLIVTLQCVILCSGTRKKLERICSIFGCVLSVWPFSTRWDLWLGIYFRRLSLMSISRHLQCGQRASIIISDSGLDREKKATYVETCTSMKKVRCSSRERSSTKWVYVKRRGCSR